MASTRPACPRRPGRSSATCASPRRRRGVEPCQRGRRRLPPGVRPARRGERLESRRGASRIGRSWSGRSTSCPTGQMVTHPDARRPRRALSSSNASTRSARADENRYLDAAGLADGLLGSTTTANILLLGVAVQAGARPGRRPMRSSEAIALNGVAVDTNLSPRSGGVAHGPLTPDAVERDRRLGHAGRRRIDRRADRSPGRRPRRLPVRRLRPPVPLGRRARPAAAERAQRRRLDARTPKPSPATSTS